MIYVEKIENNKLGCWTKSEKVARHQGWTISLQDSEIEQSEVDGNWYAAGFAPKFTDAEKLEKTRKDALAKIDQNTSNTILAGFDYDVDGEQLHFSYDSFDQQNFADTANMAMLTQTIAELPQSVVWNAYKNYTAETGGELVRLTLDVPEFLALYTGGALVHKANTMEQGGARKAQVEACGTIEQIESLLAEWGI